MTTRRSTKTTTHRAERKCSSSSSSSAFCDACVYIIKSLTEVLFNNNRGNSVTKQISLVVLSRPSVRSRGQRSKNLKPEIAQIYIRSLSFASKSDWLIVFQFNPPFFREKRVQFKSKYSFVVYLIHNRRDQWQGEGSENEHETLGLRPRSSRERKWTRGSRGVGRETIGVRRTVVSQTLEVNSFFLINLFLLYWCVFCAALAVVFCRYFTYVFALGATAVALGAVIVNSSRK